MIQYMREECVYTRNKVQFCMTLWISITNITLEFPYYCSSYCFRDLEMYNFNCFLHVVYVITVCEPLTQVAHLVRDDNDEKKVLSTVVF